VFEAAARKSGGVFVHLKKIPKNGLTRGERGKRIGIGYAEKEIR